MKSFTDKEGFCKSAVCSSRPGIVRPAEASHLKGAHKVKESGIFYLDVFVLFLQLCSFDQLKKICFWVVDADPVSVCVQKHICQIQQMLLCNNDAIQNTLNSMVTSRRIPSFGHLMFSCCVVATDGHLVMRYSLWFRFNLILIIYNGVSLIAKLPQTAQKVKPVYYVIGV